MPYHERQIVAWLAILLGAYFLARATGSKREKHAMKELLGVPLDKVKFFRNFFIQRLESIVGFLFVLIGVVATAVSLGYYLNVVRWLYMRPGTELRLAVAGGSPPRDSALGVAITAAVVVTVGSFFVVQPILDAASDAAGSLPF